MNLRAKNLKTIDNIFANFEFKIPDSPTDQEFKRILVQTEASLKQALDDDFDSPLTAAMVKQMLKSLNFRMKLPLPPVRIVKILIQKRCKLHLIQLTLFFN